MICVASTAVAEQEEAMGTFSLVTNPLVMVYLDGARTGMSPIINRRLTTGEHRVSLLLLLPSGNRLRADYRVIVETGRETMASLDLTSNAPDPGEVRTLAPAPANPQPQVNPIPQPNPQPPVNPNPQPNPQPQQPDPTAGGWASSPGHAPSGPREVASLPSAPTPPQPVAPAPPPEPARGLTREMVREGMEGMRSAMQRCMGAAAGLVQVRLTIMPDGGVSDVETQGAYHGTQIGDCIEAALPEEAAFPIYTGDPFPVVYPFRFVAQ